MVKQWPLYQLDIKNVFLHDDLQEEVFILQSPGYEVQGEIENVYKLKKAIYGLKQSPQAWFDKFSIIIAQILWIETKLL